MATNASSPSRFWGRSTTAVPVRDATMVTAGAPPQRTLTLTRNTVSVPVEVGVPHRTALCQWQYCQFVSHCELVRLARYGCDRWKFRGGALQLSLHLPR